MAKSIKDVHTVLRQIRNKEDLLEAMRMDPEFVKQYSQRIAETAAEELAHSDRLADYFAGDAYAEQVSGRRKDHYTVFRALIILREECGISDREFVRCFSVMVRDIRKLKKSMREKVAAIALQKEKKAAADLLLQEIAPVLSEYFLKERVDDFGNSIGVYGASETADKKKSYRDDIALFRSYEAYLNEGGTKGTEAANRKEAAAQADPEMLQVFYDALRKDPENENLCIPLITDAACGTGIYIIGRRYVIYDKNDKEDLYTDMPEWYEKDKWYLDAKKDQNRCFLCVLRLGSVEKPIEWNVDTFNCAENVAYAQMRYVITVCRTVRRALEEFDKYRSKLNYFGDLSPGSTWPVLAEPKYEKALRAQYFEYFTCDATEEELQIMERYARENAVNEERQQKREADRERRLAYMRK
jgi:hypothetical protein